jgi:hypothetical protein
VCLFIHRYIGITCFIKRVIHSEAYKIEGEIRSYNNFTQTHTKLFQKYQMWYFFEVYYENISKICENRYTFEYKNNLLQNMNTAIKCHLTLVSERCYQRGYYWNKFIINCVSFDSLITIKLLNFLYIYIFLNDFHFIHIEIYIL